MRDLAWSTETVLAAPRLLRSASDSSPRAAGFLHPTSIRANADVIVMADAGDDRLLMLDSTGSVMRSFGKRGRGPGELLGVSHIHLRDSSVLAGEAHNGRVSEFRLDGTFIGTRVAGFAAGAVSADNQHVYTASRSNDFYANLASDDSLPANALRRPAYAGGTARGRWSKLPGHDLIVSDSATTWVFDQGRGILCEFASPEAPPDCNRLPRRILERLERYRDSRVDQLESAIRMRVEAAPLAKDMILAGHYLALLLPFPDLPILLIDPNDASLTPVMTFGGPLPDWARSARSFAWDGTHFLLVGDEGLGRLDLSTIKSTYR
jgi:hypothetical protein